jgi:hypothetical protein
MENACQLDGMNTLETKETEIANAKNTNDRSVAGKIVTIQDAINAYKGHNAEAEGYRSLVTFLIDSGFDQPFKNDSYYDALILTEAMLNRANHSIKLLTGPACDGFYCAISDYFTQALERIQRAGGQVKMIILGDSYPKGLTELASKFAGTFEIALAKPFKDLQHFIVCDSKIVRIENIHGKLDGQSSAHEIKADVNFNDPAKGKMLETFFESIWSVVNPNKKARST